MCTSQPDYTRGRHATSKPFRLPFRQPIQCCEICRGCCQRSRIRTFVDPILWNMRDCEDHKRRNRNLGARLGFRNHLLQHLRGWKITQLARPAIRCRNPDLVQLSILNKNSLKKLTPHRAKQHLASNFLGSFFQNERISAPRAPLPPHPSETAAHLSQ